MIGQSTFFGSIKLKKLSLLHDLDILDQAKESRSLTEDEGRQESELHLALDHLLNQEELYRKQRSRVKWLKEGDENTKFFHTVANGRRNRNFIPRIMDGECPIVASLGPKETHDLNFLSPLFLGISQELTFPH